MTVVAGTTTATIVGYPVKTCVAAKAAQNDTIVLPAPGGMPLNIMVANNGDIASAAEYGWKFNVLCAAEPAAGTFTATDTTIEYDGAVASTRPSGNYYVMNPTTGEIMHVVTDDGYSTTEGTVTVQRGCLGTTAGTIANNTYLAIIGSVYLPINLAGKAIITYLELPADPRAKFY